MPELHIDTYDRLPTWNLRSPELPSKGTDDMDPISDMSTSTDSSTSFQFVDDLKNGSQTESRSYPSKPDDDVICVVGMGKLSSTNRIIRADPLLACRLPGDVHSPAELWDFLMKNKTGQCRVPAQRFNIDGFYNKDDSRAGVMSADGGYFLNEDVRQFDNTFFGINNLEATYRKLKPLSPYLLYNGFLPMLA